MNTSTSTIRHRSIAAAILTLLLLLLAFRLTSTESLRETITQKSYRITSIADPNPSTPIPLPIIGPAFTSAYATLTFLLAAAATYLAAKVKDANLLSPRRIAQFLLISLTFILLYFSTRHSANRLNSITGTADIAASLSAAWTLLLLCHDSLLGNRARHALLAAIIALLAMGTARAFLQHFVEFPDLAQFVKEHPDEAFRNQGIENDPVQQTLFLYRLHSAEVSGFGALSNVFATQSIPFTTLLVALLIAALPLFRKKTSPSAHSQPLPPSKRPSDHKSTKPLAAGTEIPLHLLAFIAIALLLLAGFASLAMTGSKGGFAAALLALLAVTLGALFWKPILRHRKPLLAATLLLAIAAPIALIHYGRVHDALPTKSLLFRWHYWTASVPIIDSTPTWGVGLNNFGDFYLQYKRPSSPEDVKDPHNFFIRLLTETGLPATLALTALLLWLLHCAFRPTTQLPSSTSNAERPTSNTQQSLAPPLLLSALIALLWIPLHLLFAEEPNDYTTTLTILYAVFGWFIFATTYYLLQIISTHHLNAERPTPNAQRFLDPTRYLSLTAALSALAMLLYDQVNMALITGPIALLFWLLLALSASHTPSMPNAGRRTLNIPALTIALLWLAASLTTLFTLTLPLFAATFPWDPDPYEYQYLHQLQAHNPQLAKQALDAALARNPNSIELRLQRFALYTDPAYRTQLNLPIADEIRTILSLDRANAKPRLILALPDTDLPPKERIAALEEALKLDQALPPNEAKHLTPEQITQIQAKIRELQLQNH